MDRKFCPTATTSLHFRTSDTQRAESIENSLMVDPIKSSAEVDLHNRGLLSALQCTLQCKWHTQKRITGTQTFPISKLGGWRHTTVLYKSSETNHHQTLKHLWQYWCYGNWSVIGSRGGRWTFWNWGDICLSPASRETTQTKKPSKHHTETWNQNISRSLQKERKHTKRVSATKRVQV